MILDCTIRDGGYYTNWDFEDSLIDSYIEHTNKLPIDYIEIGYRNLPQKSYFGKYYFLPKYILEHFRNKSTKKIALMLNVKAILPTDIPQLLNDCIGYVDMVRLAVNPTNFDDAINIAKLVKNLGFEVSFNIMYMSNWDNINGLYDNISKLTTNIVDYIYMVDSYGSIIPDDITTIYNSVRTILDSNIKIGFHGHNNMELALINTVKATELGVDCVDSTITGIGRGAGNLKTELLLTYLESKCNLPIDYDNLSELTHIFTELQDVYKWGTQLPYMVSGAHSLPQANVMEWVTSRIYSLNSIIRGLFNETHNEYPTLDKKYNANNVLIIGGGETVQQNKHAILEFIKQNPNTVLIHTSTRNANIFKNVENQIFCLIGNEGLRLAKTFNLNTFNDVCVIPAIRTMGTYLPNAVLGKTYQLPTDIILKYGDSSTELALEIANFLEIPNKFIIGFDGYADLSEYKSLKLFNENNNLFSMHRGLISLFPTLYTKLNVLPIYNFLK